MARPVVVNSDGVRVPFLRGILTRSLQDAGLAFDDAYRISGAVREELSDVPALTSEELRGRVLKQLEGFDQSAAARYRQPASAAPTILVRHTNDEQSAFSRGRLRLCLESCALLPDEAFSIASRVHDRLMREGVREVDARDLQKLTHSTLAAELSAEAARSYVIWEEFRRSGRPLLILIGGATGCGKTTLATQLAHMLEFVRMQSTDMLRQVMRVMVPSSLLPVLHMDSFRAWEVLPPQQDRESEDPDALLALGYLQQAELLSVACEAAIRRAVEENVSLILEGVHVHPSLLQRIPPDIEAIVVPVLLAILKPDQLRQRLIGRTEEAPARRGRYEGHVDAIWRLQSFLLSEADRSGIPIVVNEERDTTIQQICSHIIAVLTETFRGAAQEVSS